MTPERRRAIAAALVPAPQPYQGALIDCLVEIDRLTALVAEDGDASALLHAHDEMKHQLATLEREVAEARAERDAGLQISGSFFEALKPLNLSAINVADPGQHVTELRQRAEEAERLVVSMSEQCAETERRLNEMERQRDEWREAYDAMARWHPTLKQAFDAARPDA